MKKSIWLLSLLWILVLSGCGGSKNIVEYNDSFVALVKECTDANQALFQTFNTEWTTIDTIVTSLQNNIVTCDNAKKKALDLWDYEKDSSLKDGVVNLLAMEVDYLQKFWSTERYRNIDNITEEDKLAYDWLVSSLNESQNSLNNQFTNLQEIQEGFAAKYGLRLE